LVVMSPRSLRERHPVGLVSSAQLPVIFAFVWSALDEQVLEYHCHLRVKELVRGIGELRSGRRDDAVVKRAG